MSETATMGSVNVHARIENNNDLVQVRLGQIPAEQVRAIEVTDALVDTGATYLSLPRSAIDLLGLTLVRKRKIRTSAGPTEAGQYGVVRIIIHDRDCLCDVLELPDGRPTLIGQVPLELMDWVVDSVNRRLMGNPAHNGEWMADAF